METLQGDYVLIGGIYGQAVHLTPGESAQNILFKLGVSGSENFRDWLYPNRRTYKMNPKIDTEIAELAAQGKTPLEIAEALYMRHEWNK